MLILNEVAVRLVVNRKVSPGEVSVHRDFFIVAAHAKMTANQGGKFKTYGDICPFTRDLIQNLLISLRPSLCSHESQSRHNLNIETVFYELLVALFPWLLYSWNKTMPDHSPNF